MHVICIARASLSASFTWSFLDLSHLRIFENIRSFWSFLDLFSVFLQALASRLADTGDGFGRTMPPRPSNDPWGQPRLRPKHREPGTLRTLVNSIPACLNLPVLRAERAESLERLDCRSR